MSQPEGQRKEGKNKKFIGTLDLVKYTLTITKNENIFLPEYRGEVTDFLGFHYCQTETGKIIMTVKPANVKAERAKLRKLARCLRDGKITPKKFHDCYSAWRNHASGGNRCVQSKWAYRVKHKYYGKANSFRLLERMDAYCKTLLEGNNYGLRE